MKKIITFLCSICILATLVFSMPVSAAGASLSLSKSALRAGDTFSVTLNASLSGALTVNGSFSYSGPITLTSISGKTGTMDRNGNNIFIDLGNSAISGNKAVAVANFKVNSSAKTDDKISVSFSGFYSNLSGDTPISGSTSSRISPPLASNCNLQGLTVSNANLTPAFSVGNTSYSAGEVDFSVSRLDIKAVAEDSKAKVTVSGNNLTVGKNTVTVSVKAENGATKNYKISVTRKQDPNYVASSDVALSNITVNGFLISPPFSAQTNSYTVWLPYETTEITVTATPADSKARVSITGGKNLVEGDNEVIISCIAEDGTGKNYRVLAKRAYKDGAAVTEPIEDTQAPPAASSTDTTLLIILCVVSFILGAVITLIIFTIVFKKNKG